MTDLRVTLVQTPLVWHQPETNRAQLGEKLEALAGQTDLIVLPEMFTSGFTVHPESMAVGSDTIDWLLLQAQRLGSAITGSIACEANASGSDESPYVNRLLFATPEGDVLHYDKVHLFRMANEHKRYQSGDQRCVIRYKGWRLLLTVCYDLRFPVFCRNRFTDNQFDYDAMICVANWPEARRHHWQTLLQARAIENQAFVVGVNRVGTDGHGLDYVGDSMAIDARGAILLHHPGEWVDTVELNRQALVDYRQQFPVWRDADSFSMTLKNT